VPGSINVGLSGQFASWAGQLVPADQEIILVADDAAGVHEATVRLARVGLERVSGFLDGGIAAWDRAGLPLARLPQLSVDDLLARLGERRELQVLDVRRGGEYEGGHVPGALHTPLDRLAERVARLDRARPTAIICAGGYRSSAASSLLLRAGWSDLYNVAGGTSAWVRAGHPVERAKTT
jgi:hydroxyacylglutathione hydrolase